MLNCTKQPGFSIDFQLQSSVVMQLQLCLQSPFRFNSTAIAKNEFIKMLYISLLKRKYTQTSQALHKQNLKKYKLSCSNIIKI